MEFYRDLSVFYTMVHVLIIFGMLFESRYSKKHTYISIIVCMGILILFHTFLFLSYGMKGIREFFVFTYTLPSLVCFFVMTKHRNGKFFFTFCMADLFAYWILIVTNLFCFVLQLNDWFLFWFRLLLFPLIEWYVLRQFKNSYKMALNTLKKGWTEFALISVLFYLLLMLMTNWPTAITKRIEDMPAFIIVLIILPLIYGTVLRAANNQMAMYDIQRKDTILHTQVQALKNQVKTLQETEKKTRILRHDMRHYVQGIASFLREGNIGSALDYIGQMEAGVQKLTVSQYCKNIIVNAILSFYIEKAKQEGITVQTQLDIPQKIGINDVELSVVLANAIENAYHACKQIPKGQEKSIHIACVSYPSFVLKISNTYTGQILFDEYGCPISTKEEHGIGTQSIAAFAKKYNAVLDYQTENGYFHLRLLLAPDLLEDT